MVIKGNARGGASTLAQHLQRTDTNERMEVRELRGVMAEDLDGALREMEAVASGARSGRHFYHASINTRADEVMTPAQWQQAIDRLERELDLTDQPRAVVAHVKEGRAHIHIVWSRIDLQTMKAIPDSHNYRRHELVARELERDFGHARVQGAHIERDGERPSRTPSHAQMQQAERAGLDAKEAKAQLTAIWNLTDSGKAFNAGIEEQGWILARGDRRAFVVIDSAGEVHSLARMIDGTKAKDIRNRMAEIDPAKLPSVAEARAQQLAREKERAGQAQTERSDDDRLKPTVATTNASMAAQQAEAMRRFKTNSEALNERRVAEAKTKPEDERLQRFKEQLDKNFGRSDPGDRSR